MASELEEQKKLVLPFLQRAQEIQQADLKVAYYCRMYAVDQALKLPHRAKEITGLLTATLSQLERDKAQVKLDPAADRIHCLGFALRIFDNADRVDRAGKATERTSRAFYAASVFIEILNQFEGGVDSELLEKQRYCAWRAAEIRKALREGRQPTPPPAAENATAAAASTAGDGTVALADLPPASGSSHWAYSGPPAVPPPPPPHPSEGSFTGADLHSVGATGAYSISDLNDNMIHGGHAPMPPQHAHDRAPPPSSFWAPSAGRGWEGAEAPPQPPSYGSAAAARFWPGAKLLVRTDEGLEDGAAGLGQQQPGTQVGTVGQVIRRPDGGFSYKVALADRLVEVPDEAAVPSLREGDDAWLVGQPPGAAAGGGSGFQQQQQQPSTVRVLLINEASWPPSYLVQTDNGKEQPVTAQQLAPPARNGVASCTTATTTTAAAASAPTQPPVLHPPPPPPPAPPQAPAPPSAPSFSQPPFGAATPPATAPPTPAYPSPYGGHAAPRPSAGPQAYSHSYSGPAPAPSAGVAQQGYGYAAPSPSKPSVQLLTDAQKQAKYAVSALSFEDVPTAVKHLSEALRLLTSPQQQPPPAGAYGGPARR